MTITRHNYETFFLLYVDKELPAEQRREVEIFVAENTDLKIELDMLLETAMPVEDINFSEKNSLYRKELSSEVLQNMLLHLDNELDPASVKSLESDIASNASFYKEWNVLRQTKLDQAEKLVFADKKLLYRRERKVVPLWFLRVAVAAAITGAGLFVGLSFFNNNTGKSGEELAGMQKNTQPLKTLPPVNSGVVPKVQDQKIITADKETTVAATINDLKAVSARKNSMATVAGKNSSQTEVVRKENNIPESASENINILKSNKQPFNDVRNEVAGLPNKNDNEVAIQPLINPDKKIIQQVIPINYNTLTETASGYAKTAVLDESATENSNHILFINEEKINRTKFSGFIKRARRILARNTNIQTGGSLKIAGFEVAAR